MPFLTDEELASFIDNATKADFDKDNDINPATNNPHRYPGDPTYGKKPNQLPSFSPEEVHFYYFGIGNDNTLRGLVYKDSSSGVLDDAKIKAWIKDAKKDGAGAFSNSPDDIEWDQPGLLMFCADMPGWNILERTDDVNNTYNASLYFAAIGKAASKRKKHANHSFYGATTHDVSVDSQTYRMTVVENHHLRAPASNSGKKYEKRKNNCKVVDEYKFDLFYTLPLESNTSKKLIVILDPGGKNTGPGGNL